MYNNVTVEGILAAVQDFYTVSTPNSWYTLSLVRLYPRNYITSPGDLLGASRISVVSPLVEDNPLLVPGVSFVV